MDNTRRDAYGGPGPDGSPNAGDDNYSSGGDFSDDSDGGFFSAVLDALGQFLSGFGDMDA